MKTIIFSLFICFGILTSAQNVTHVLHFKDGTTKTGTIKMGAKKLKYRASKKDKFEEIDLSTLDYGVTTYKKKDITETWGYASVKKGKKPILMQITYLGENIRLYEWNAGDVSRGASSGSVSGGVSVSVIRHFAQRTDENFATMLRSGTVMGKSFEKRARPYFKDCKSLLKLLGKDGYKKGDIKAVIEYYDNECS